MKSLFASILKKHSKRDVPHQTLNVKETAMATIVRYQILVLTKRVKFAANKLGSDYQHKARIICEN